MMREKLTHAVEDYLKTIYQIQAQEGRASTSEIADCLEINPASVNGMIKKLATSKPPLVVYRKYQGVVLSPEGEKAALEVLQHQRLLEQFLHQILGYEWEDVYEEADRLEHVISEEFEERIAAAMGNPNYDPHGDPIPTRELQVPDTPQMRACDLRAGSRAVIHRVQDRDPKLLKHLSEIGIIPHAHLEVLEYSYFDQNLRLQVEGRAGQVVLGPQITNQIFVVEPG